MEQETKHHIKVAEFEGPLDLLLFLIRRSEIDIYDIPIAEITEQYLEYLEYAAKVDLDNVTEFYVMAATLLYIKSRTLLPGPDLEDDEPEDPRRELVDRLIEYQKYRKLAEIMEKKEEENEWVLDRKKKQVNLPFPNDESLWDQIDVWDLVQTFSQIVSSLSPERIIDLYEEVTINEKVTLIHERLEAEEHFPFTDLLTKKHSTMDLVCAFLAVLESVKVKLIRIFQNRMFGDIHISRGRDFGKEAEA